MSRLNKLSLCLLLSALPAVSVTAADIEKLNTDVVVVGGQVRRTILIKNLNNICENF